MITISDPKTKKILITVFIILDILIVSSVAIFFTFRQQITEWGAGLTRMEDWKENYKQQNPGATDAEADAALDKSFADIKLWKEEYKRNNPGATDEQADQAWAEAWKK